MAMNGRSWMIELMPHVKTDVWRSILIAEAPGSVLVVYGYKDEVTYFLATYVISNGMSRQWMVDHEWLNWCYNFGIVTAHVKTDIENMYFYSRGLRVLVDSLWL